MANLWGKHLGLIALHLRADGKRWVIEKDKTRVEARAAQNADKSFVAPDPQVGDAVDHRPARTALALAQGVGRVVVQRLAGHRREEPERDHGCVSSRRPPLGRL